MFFRKKEVEFCRTYNSYLKKYQSPEYLEELYSLTQNFNYPDQIEIEILEQKTYNDTKMPPNYVKIKFCNRIILINKHNSLYNTSLHNKNNVNIIKIKNKALEYFNTMYTENIAKGIVHRLKDELFTYPAHLREFFGKEIMEKNPCFGYAHLTIECLGGTMRALNPDENDVQINHTDYITVKNRYTTIQKYLIKDFKSELLNIRQRHENFLHKLYNTTEKLTGDELEYLEFYFSKEIIDFLNN